MLTKAKQDVVHGGLRIHFPEAMIEVHSDLLGTVTFHFVNTQRKDSLAFLEPDKFTFYNGYFLSSKVLLLGFILGDEAESCLWKKILKSFLYSELPTKFAFRV